MEYYRHEVKLAPPATGHYGIETYATKHDVGRRKFKVLGMSQFMYGVPGSYEVSAEASAASEACWAHANEHLPGQWAVSPQGLFHRFGVGDMWRGRIAQNTTMAGDEVVHVTLFWRPAGVKAYMDLMFVKGVPAEQFRTLNVDLDVVLEEFLTRAVREDMAGVGTNHGCSDNQRYTRAEWRAHCDQVEESYGRIAT